MLHYAKSALRESKRRGSPGMLQLLRCAGVPWAISGSCFQPNFLAAYGNGPFLCLLDFE
jgi:hypothetical protein